MAETSPLPSKPLEQRLDSGLASLATHWLDYVAIVLGIVIVAIVSYLTLSLAGRIVQLVGANGMSALTKIMGFLIFCIGIQFVVNGAVNIATDPAVVQALHGGSR